jgi:tRNA(Arg) A34 adenosine deaminase TadA
MTPLTPASPTDFTLTLPEWTAEELARLPGRLAGVDERMRLVLRLARSNFERDTGGPFAAAVFERDSGRLVSIGVNQVVATGCSSAHGEVMALSLAQKSLGSWDLGGPGLPVHQLVVNWRPCTMCFGAVLWSGVRSLAIAGSGPELEELTGFDEGPLSSRWAAELEEREVEVVDDVLRQEACEVFRAFRDSGRFVYNARQGELGT